MPFFLNGSLREQLKRQGSTITTPDAIELARQIALALEATHRQGVIHLDLKPENILVQADPAAGAQLRLFLSDFGAARLRDKSNADRAVMGTAKYMSPEQCDGDPEQLTPASDIYSLGIILFELLTGRPPFEHPSSTEICRMQRNEMVPLQILRERGVEEEVVALVNRMLHKFPNRRPTASSVEKELQRLARGADKRNTPDTTQPRRHPTELLQPGESGSHPRGEVKPYVGRPANPLRRLADARKLVLFGVSAAIVATAISENAPIQHAARASFVALVRIATQAVKSQTPALHVLSERGPECPDLPAGMIHVAKTYVEVGREPAVVDEDCAYLRSTGSQCFEELLKRDTNPRSVLITAFDADQNEQTNQQGLTWLRRHAGFKRDGAFDLRPETKPDANSPSIRYLYESPASDAKLITDFGKNNPFYRDENGEIQVKSQAANKPMVGLTHRAAEMLCEDQGKRLLTDAEWELIASGTERRRWPWGFEDPDCSGVVFARNPKTHDNAAGTECLGATGLSEPANVGTSRQDRSPEGFNDLGGNVAEWVLDNFDLGPHACPEPCVDPVVRTPKLAAEDQKYLFRGGGWGYAKQSLLSYYKGQLPFGGESYSLGARCARKHKEELR